MPEGTVTGDAGARIVIVGAGPAGATLAYLLAPHGKRAGRGGAEGMTAVIPEKRPAILLIPWVRLLSCQQRVAAVRERRVP